MPTHRHGDRQWGGYGCLVAMDEVLGQRHSITRAACLFALQLIHGRAQLYGCRVLPTEKCVLPTTERGEPGTTEEEEVQHGFCGGDDGEGGGL